MFIWYVGIHGMFIRYIGKNKQSADKHRVIILKFDKHKMTISYVDKHRMFIWYVNKSKCAFDGLVNVKWGSFDMSMNTGCPFW